MASLVNRMPPDEGVPAAGKVVDIVRGRWTHDPGHFAQMRRDGRPTLPVSADRCNIVGITVGVARVGEMLAGPDERHSAQGAEDVSATSDWGSLRSFDEFALACCGRPHLKLKTDPESFSLVQRLGQMGPVTVSEFVVGSDTWMDNGAECGAYRVLVLQTGRTERVRSGLTFNAGPGTATVYAPRGLGAARWAAGTKMTCFRIDACTAHDALSDALGHSVTAHIDLNPVLPMRAEPTRSWIDMLLLFKEQFFRPDGLLNHPMVGLPFAESLVRGFWLAVEHGHRDALAGTARLVAPRAIRTAIEIIQEEAHAPLTLTAISARCNVSVRSLQQGFQRYLGTSPMSYLREVRLRRAHQALLHSDPSTTTVASVAYHWGFSNLGRFAAAHAARYGEPPAQTLRRSA